MTELTPTMLQGIALLHSIYVDPPFWRRGVVRVLFGAAVARDRKLKAGAFVIYAKPSGEGFYKRLGAIRTGEGPFVFSPDLILPHFLYLVHQRSDMRHVARIGHGVMNHAMMMRFFCPVLLLGVIAGFTLLPAVAEEKAAPAIHQLSASDLGAFLDPLMKGELARLKIAGAVVVVVKDDGILFARGYGYSDIQNQRPMTPDTTLVRPGSISKLFTGMAVMQLVEQGKLDLDRDVNDYLDFHIPTPDGGVPVTLRRLMTHRAGFEEHFKGLFSADRMPEPLGHWLARSLPRRLFPAGDVSAYS